MKKWIALLLAMAMMMSLCACGSAASSETATESTTQPTETAASNSSEAVESAAEEDSLADYVIGEWVYADSMFGTTDLTVSEDGSYETSLGETGTWTVEEDQLVLTSNSGEKTEVETSNSDGIEGLYSGGKLVRPEDYTRIVSPELEQAMVGEWVLIPGTDDGEPCERITISANGTVEYDGTIERMRGDQMDQPQSVQPIQDGLVSYEVYHVWIMAEDESGYLNLWMREGQNGAIESLDFGIAGRYGSYRKSDASEAIELTMDNWSEYYEVLPYEEWEYNAFQEAESLALEYIFKIKDEIIDQMIFPQNTTDWEQLCTSVEVSYDDVERDISVDWTNTTYSLGDAKCSAPCTEVVKIDRYLLMEKGYVILGSGPAGPNSTGICIPENLQITRILGTIYLKK